MKNKKVKQMMNDVARCNWQVCREDATNDLVNSWKLYKQGYCLFDSVETRFISLTASELKGE